MLNSKELLGYRVETIGGLHFSLQLFANGVLIYKTYVQGVRNGVAKHSECFFVRGTPFLQTCKALIKRYQFIVNGCPNVDEAAVTREALICLGHVAGSSFFHGSDVSYSDKNFPDLTPEDFQAALGDCSDGFVNAFFKAYPSLKQIENSPYLDYLDPFLQMDIHQGFLDAYPERTGGFEKFLRPCLNSYHDDDGLELTKEKFIGLTRMEDYLDKTLFKTILSAKSQEDLDKRIQRIKTGCHKAYPSRYLFEDDLEIYLSQLVLAFVLKGQIKSTSLLRWLRPDYRDVIAWYGDKNASYFDYPVSLKYFRWRSEKEKWVPIFFYQYLEGKNETYLVQS